MTIRAVFFGTPSFALPTLEALHQSDSINLLGVLTQPDRPSGRGKQLHPPPVKEWALPHDLDLLQPASLKEPEVMSWLERHAPDVIVVVAYGGYVPKTVREMTRFGCVNLHPSLLPRYRGAAPIRWAIMRGDRMTGNTTMYLAQGWDAGDIIYQVEEPIHPSDTYDSLSDRLAEKGAALVVKTLIDLEQGKAPRTPQSEEGVVFAPLIQNEDTRIDWNVPAIEIHNKVRGLHSIPGAFTVLDDMRLKILRTDVLPFSSERKPG